jgi:hypothetical protein
MEIKAPGGGGGFWGRINIESLNVKREENVQPRRGPYSQGY